MPYLVLTREGSDGGDRQTEREARVGETHTGGEGGKFLETETYRDKCTETDRQIDTWSDRHFGSKELGSQDSNTRAAPAFC